MKNYKKVFRIVLVAILGILIFSLSAIGFAEDNNIGYSFTIKANYGNSYSSARYRQTKSKENPWKVQLKSSGEGKGTITTFWLSKSTIDGTVVVSPTRNVKQGSGATYSGAYGSASKSHVKLGAENNNYSANTYTISGIWDEETW